IMRLLKHLNCFRQSLRQQRRSRRPERLQNRPCVEPLEDRLVPATLDVNLSVGKVFGHYTASPGVNNNLTLSEKPLGFFTQIIITDTAETINVVGTAAGGFQGSGTHTVTTFLPCQSLFVDVLDGNDTVNVKGINYITTVRHIGTGLDTVNVGDA